MLKLVTNVIHFPTKKYTEVENQSISTIYCIHTLKQKTSIRLSLYIESKISFQVYNLHYFHYTTHPCFKHYILNANYLIFHTISRYPQESRLD